MVTVAPPMLKLCTVNFSTILACSATHFLQLRLQKQSSFFLTLTRTEVHYFCNQSYPKVLYHSYNRAISTTTNNCHSNITQF
ncbi:hypothetical protein C2G38_2086786 [Gigaspora rosea]|uniref:Uncharacterized protein n=1 Tax=Gigaspora rosea TaxID=44941 RepID=A0A397VFC1_9GLOM|nr:hypothetical protein C2G38_2086786 [Gigaspora rosea]